MIPLGWPASVSRLCSRDSLPLPLCPVLLSVPCLMPVFVRYVSGEICTPILASKASPVNGVQPALSVSSSSNAGGPGAATLCGRTCFGPATPARGLPAAPRAPRARSPPRAPRPQPRTRPATPRAPHFPRAHAPARAPTCFFRVLVYDGTTMLPAAAAAAQRGGVP